MRSVLRGVALAVITCLMAVPFLLIEERLHAPKGFLSSPDVVGLLVRPALVAFATLAGILFRTVYEELTSPGGATGATRSIVRGALSSRNFWIALIVSPVVILPFYKTLAEVESNALVTLMSYENGFFFRSVLSRRERT